MRSYQALRILPVLNAIFSLLFYPVVAHVAGQRINATTSGKVRIDRVDLTKTSKPGAFARQFSNSFTNAKPLNDEEAFLATNHLYYNLLHVPEKISKWEAAHRIKYLNDPNPISIHDYFFREVLGRDDVHCSIKNHGCTNLPSGKEIMSVYSKRNASDIGIDGVSAFLHAQLIHSYYQIPALILDAVDKAQPFIESQCANVAETFFHKGEKDHTRAICKALFILGFIFDPLFYQFYAGGAAKAMPGLAKAFSTIGYVQMAVGAVLTAGAGIAAAFHAAVATVSQALSTAGEVISVGWSRMLATVGSKLGLTAAEGAVVAGESIAGAEAAIAAAAEAGGAAAVEAGAAAANVLEVAAEAGEAAMVAAPEAGAIVVEGTAGTAMGEAGRIQSPPVPEVERPALPGEALAPQPEGITPSGGSPAENPSAQIAPEALSAEKPVHQPEIQPASPEGEVSSAQTPLDVPTTENLSDQPKAQPPFGHDGTAESKLGKNPNTQTPLEQSEAESGGSGHAELGSSKIQKWIENMDPNYRPQQDVIDYMPAHEAHFLTQSEADSLQHQFPYSIESEGSSSTESLNPGKVQEVVENMNPEPLSKQLSAESKGSSSVESVDLQKAVENQSSESLLEQSTTDSETNWSGKASAQGENFDPSEVEQWLDKTDFKRPPKKQPALYHGPEHKGYFLSDSAEAQLNQRPGAPGGRLEKIKEIKYAILNGFKHGGKMVSATARKFFNKVAEHAKNAFKPFQKLGMEGGPETESMKPIELEELRPETAPKSYAEGLRNNIIQTNERVTNWLSQHPDPESHLNHEILGPDAAKDTLEMIEAVPGEAFPDYISSASGSSSSEAGLNPQTKPGVTTNRLDKVSRPVKGFFGKVKDQAKYLLKEPTAQKDAEAATVKLKQLGINEPAVPHPSDPFGPPAVHLTKGQLKPWGFVKDALLRAGLYPSKWTPAPGPQLVPPNPYELSRPPSDLLRPIMNLQSEMSPQLLEEFSQRLFDYYEKPPSIQHRRATDHYARHFRRGVHHVPQVSVGGGIWTEYEAEAFAAHGLKRQPGSGSLIINYPAGEDESFNEYVSHLQGNLNHLGVMDGKFTELKDMGNFNYQVKGNFRQFANKLEPNLCWGGSHFEDNSKHNTKVCREVVRGVFKELKAHIIQSVDKSAQKGYLKRKWKSGASPANDRINRSLFRYPKPITHKERSKIVNFAAKNIETQSFAQLLSLAWRNVGCYVKCSHGASSSYGCTKQCWAKDKEVPVYGWDKVGEWPWNFNQGEIVPYSVKQYKMGDAENLPTRPWTLSPFDSNTATSQAIPILPVCENPPSPLERVNDKFPCVCGNIYGSRSAVFWASMNLANLPRKFHVANTCTRAFEEPTLRGYFPRSGLGQ